MKADLSGRGGGRPAAWSQAAGLPRSERAPRRGAAGMTRSPGNAARWSHGAAAERGSGRATAAVTTARGH
jgi:hypothetical protein